MGLELEFRAALHRALADPHRLAIVDALRFTDRSPGSLRDVTGIEWNLLAFHLNTLETAGVIERRESEGDHRPRYVRLRPSALTGLWPADVMPSGEPVLFVCTHNAARSQFAAGLWNVRSRLRASSAGTDPAPVVHPLAVVTAEAYGVDLADARPRGYTAVSVPPGLVVSVCDRAF
jgi:ArsR family transcriptional regulator, arsenate/arsenite/antimonite-responsive transcriptional repressor / arsenate reductase (thioredoxin)